MYEGHLRNHILPFAGDRPAASLRRSDSTAFVDHLLGTPSLRSPRSVVQVFKTWRILINYMMDEDVSLPVNTVSRIELPEVCCSTEVALTSDQVAAVAAAMRQIEPRYEIAVWLASCAGLRRGEALGLKWEHIDWEWNLLCIREQRLRGQDAPLKTKASSATLPVDAFLIGQLARHLARFVPPGAEPRLLHAKGRNGAAVQLRPSLVVTNTHGQPVQLSHFYCRWHQALERAGLPPRTRFHQLKHFYTSTLAMSGEHDPKTVQLLSRHARFSETWDTYAQPPRTAAELRVNVFSSVFSVTS
ncbi:site-specific integrase [Streptomyces sp. NPDC096057]|uniref:site-specific integrase n=1 Tax=Streptomyces sp. NPDC096057 TaxID=3155543 RepID=UPI00331A4F39